MSPHSWIVDGLLMSRPADVGGRQGHDILHHASFSTTLTQKGQEVFAGSQSVRH